MRKIRKIRTQENRRYRRHLRVRRKVAGSAERPRLVVFRSSKHIYAQIVDDARGVTLVGAADTSEGLQVDGRARPPRASGWDGSLPPRLRRRGSPRSCSIAAATSITGA